MRTFQEEEKIKLLADVIKIQSENDNEIEVCHYLKNLLAHYDIPSKILKVSETRANLVAEIGSGSPILAMSGHMDVVDAGRHDKWTYPPFELTEQDGRLYGRGTTDMKGALMGMVIALIELKMADHMPSGTIRLLATAGEEKEQEGAKLFAEEGYLDDLDGLMIGEPTDNGVFYAHKGSMACKVTATGVAAHSSMPFLGKNAIDTLVQFINQLHSKYDDIKKNDLKHELDVAPMVNKFMQGSLSEEEENFASGFTMMGSIINGGKQFNSVPEEASIEYNVRPVPEYNNDFVTDLFQQTIDEVNRDALSFEIVSNHRPVTSDKDSTLIKVITEVAPHYVNKEDVFVAAFIGTTDASSLLGDNLNNVDLAIVGPGITIMAHQVDEYIEKDMYLKYIDIYKDVAVKYLAEK
ncbi:ArgE/DapE family deacylase [Staphylococcus taiwanensis]|nr:ArgE/DapE family deacylase [Staphylococcus taiwanensis]